VLEDRGTRLVGKTMHAIWSCQCVCGEVRVIQGSNLTSGRSKSCGCLMRRRFDRTKKCPRCEKSKPNTDFYSQPHWRDRSRLVPATYCKDCNSALGAIAYRKNPNRRLASKKYSARLREQVLQAYGGKCACCGENNHVFLAIDHVYGGGTKELTAGNSTNLYRRLRDLGFPKDDYQCLCHNCNWAKHITGGCCPHLLQRAPDGFSSGVLGFGG
jgi:hypothetical protein